MYKTSRHTEYAARDFTAKVRDDLSAKGITIIGLQATYPAYVTTVADTPISYTLDDNGLGRVLTHADVIALAAVVPQPEPKEPLMDHLAINRTLADLRTTHIERQMGALRTLLGLLKAEAELAGEESFPAIAEAEEALGAYLDRLTAG